EPGPHQADVAYSRHDGPAPWVGLNPGLTFDEKGRPIVKALDHKSGLHRMLLENGKWTDLSKSPGASASDQAAKPRDGDDDDEPETANVSQLDLPYPPHHV